MKVTGDELPKAGHQLKKAAEVVCGGAFKKPPASP
jgi:hypothetical protein